MKSKNRFIFFMVILVFSNLPAGCFFIDNLPAYPIVNREDKIPDDIEKRTPATDHHPPILHSDDYEEPVPLPYPVNTAGAEDSPFILPDGNTLYFFFTPDVRVPYDKQLHDNVSGIYVTYRTGGTWTDPQRVWLQDPGKLALDGAPFVHEKEMWFCSAREGFIGVQMFTAELKNNIWSNWKNAGEQLNVDFQIGEVHLYGDKLFFHSNRPGGKGGLDIWFTTRIEDSWSDPINVAAVNTTENESLPFISSDGKELWFTRTYLGTPAIFRSVKAEGNWSEPELIISQFAAEPTLDNAGNLYFAHHFFENNEMIEADIYVAYKK